MSEKKHGDIFKYVIIGTALILIYKVVNNFSDAAGFLKNILSILKPCVIGVIIAFFLYKPVKRLKTIFEKSNVRIISRHGMGLAMLIVYLVLFAAIGLLGNFVIPELISNITNLVVNIDVYTDRLTDFINSTGFPEQFDALLKLPEKYLEGLDITKLMSYVGVLTNVVNYVLNIIVSIVISVYVLLEKEGIFNFLRAVRNNLFKGRRARLFTVYVSKIAEVFYSYFCGLGLDSIVVGSISAVVFSIFDVPYAILLGIVVIIANMIPMFGPIVAGGIVYIVCAFAFGPIKAIWAVVFQLVLGQIDGNIIQPHIVGGKVGVSPLLVLVSVIVFGGLFGVPGMIAGVPICATIKMIVLDLLDNGELDGSGF